MLLLEQDETLDFEVDLELHTDVLQDKLLEISQHVDDKLEHFLLQLQLDDEEELDNEVQEDIFYYKKQNLMIQKMRIKTRMKKMNWNCLLIKMMNRKEMKRMICRNSCLL